MRVGYKYDPYTIFPKESNVTELEWYEETAPIYEEAWNMLKPMIRNDELINTCVLNEDLHSKSK